MHSIVRRLKSKVLSAGVSAECVGIIQLRKRVTEAEVKAAAKEQGLKTNFQGSKKYLEARNPKDQLVAVLVDYNHLILPKHAHSKQAAFDLAKSLLGAKE